MGAGGPARAVKLSNHAYTLGTTAAKYCRPDAVQTGRISHPMRMKI